MKNHVEINGNVNGNGRGSGQGTPSLVKANGSTTSHRATHPADSEVSLAASILSAHRRNRSGEPCESAPQIPGRPLITPPSDPWPDPVDGAKLLGDVAETFRRYVSLPDGAADTLALWVAHTHCFEAFLCSPRLHICSPEKECGKTTLRDVIALLVPRPVLADDLSAPVLFRSTDSDLPPTILADEYQDWLTTKSDLTSLFTSGYRQGGQAVRLEGRGRDRGVRRFNVFAPLALIGRHTLPATLFDRSIMIRLQRAKATEIRESLLPGGTHHEQVLRRQLARWTSDHTPELRTAAPPDCPTADCKSDRRPRPGAGSKSRLADNWKPLFAIATVAGGDWPQRAALAFGQLSGKYGTQSDAVLTMLLSDIREILDRTGAAKIFSKDLVHALCILKESIWPIAYHGTPITPSWLARSLHEFGIEPGTLRSNGEILKGYYASDFTDTFERYLPPRFSSPDLDPDPLAFALSAIPSVEEAGLSPLDSAEKDERWPDSSPLNPNPNPNPDPDLVPAIPPALPVRDQSDQTPGQVPPAIKSNPDNPNTSAPIVIPSTTPIPVGAYEAAMEQLRRLMNPEIHLSLRAAEVTSTSSPQQRETTTKRPTSPPASKNVSPDYALSTLPSNPLRTPM